MLRYGKSWYEFEELPNELQFTTKMYEELWKMKPNKPGIVKLFGKEFNTPRLHRSYGVPYHFNGSLEETSPIPKILQQIVNWAQNREKHLKRDTIFNQVLVNWYRDGNDYIGWHSDNEKQIKVDSSIYTISLGVTRKFKIKSNQRENKDDHELLLTNNSFCVMGGEFQKYYKHHIPKSKKIKNSRISLTLRNLFQK